MMRIQKPADLARIVKTTRQAQELTQQDVADTAGITRQSLARIEQGHGGVSIETVLRVFEKLSISLEGNPPQKHQDTDTPALTAVFPQHLGNSAIQAAAGAAQSINASAQLDSWRSALNKQEKP